MSGRHFLALLGSRGVLAACVFAHALLAFASRATAQSLYERGVPLATRSTGARALGAPVDDERPPSHLPRVVSSAPRDEPEQAPTPPDPYLGLFAVGRPAGDGFWLAGAELRLSAPLVEIAPRWLAIAFGIDAGALYGSQHLSPLRAGAPPPASPPSYTLDARAAATLGLRTRFELVSLGLRGGYSVLASQITSNGIDLALRHAGQLGIEGGIGPGEITVTLAFDLLILESSGDLIALMSSGLCF